MRAKIRAGGSLGGREEEFERSFCRWPSVAICKELSVGRREEEKKIAEN